MLRAVVLIVALFALTAQSPQPLTGIALVIGEADYQALPQLSNSIADAAAVARSLQSLGFNTTITSNLNARKLRRALDNFVEDAADADVAVIYYAGHGIEAGGENWLVPVDADATSLDEAKDQLISLSQIIDSLTVPVTLVFLDACRTNPFPPGTSFRRKNGMQIGMSAAGLGVTRGATEAGAAPARSSLGTMVGFSTEPGQAALDGPKGGNSPYAAALVRHLAAMEGTELGVVMRMVTEEVYLKTEGVQRPWVNESLTRLLYLGAQPPKLDGDEGRILTERRHLLLTITALSASQREQVEAVSREAEVPMDALYGLLRSLGASIPSNPDELEKVLDAQALRVKGLLAEDRALRTQDPEILRLSRLADDALQEGALDAYVAIWERAKTRFEEISAALDVTEDQLRVRRLEGGDIFARTAAAYELKGDYPAAAESYAQAYEQVARWDAIKAWDYKRREADAWLSQGDERGDVAALTRSILVFEQARPLAPLDTAPLAWALTRNNLGNALLVRGRGETGNASIEQAIANYRAALQVRSRAEQPALWARTQNNIAIANMELAERTGDPRLLDDAITAYRAALSVTLQQDDPLVWATMSSNLGNALERKGGAALDEAVSLHRAALHERSREQLPILWARSQESLGNALVSLGIARGNAGRIKEGTASYYLALAVIERNAQPLNWAGLQYNLGNALGSLSEFEHRSENLGQAVIAYREALKEERFERSPASWAKTQYMLGKRLWDLGEETSDLDVRREAVEAFRQSLRYYSLDRNPADWAITVYETGLRLHRLGLLGNDVAQLSEAASMLRETLGFYTRERNAEEWAETNASFAAALADYAFAVSNQKDLEEAIAAYRSVAGVQTRRDAPLQWAATQVTLAGALYYSAILREDDAPAREGRDALVKAADEFSRQNDDRRAQATLALLGKFETLISQLRP